MRRLGDGRAVEGVKGAAAGAGAAGEVAGTE